jgi:molybdenum cofactor guanylyltransferase
MKTLTAVLFVGGESRRMGTDKAMLDLNGEPLWSRQLRILHELCPAKILVSARNKPVWCPPGIEVVLDEPPSRGPLSGLTAALEKIETTHLLALAVDMPQMTSELLMKLWKLTNPGSGIVPKNRRFFESLCAIYPIESKSAAEEMLSGNNVSLHSFINTLVAKKQILFYNVPKCDHNSFQNINTLDEWMHLQAKV